jgi:hypothetical protein
MKFSGFQKYFLLLMLSFGIAQGGFALVSKTDLSSTKKSTTLQATHQQLNSSDLYFDLVEETDDDSNDSHHHLNFAVPPFNDFTFHILQNETILFQKFPSLPPFHNQKINILNCTFLI